MISPEGGSDSPLEKLFGQVTLYNQLQTQITEIRSRGGNETLQNLALKPVKETLQIVEKNIMDLLSSSKPINPNVLALKADIERMNRDVPFDKSVFLMTKFPDKPGKTLKDQQLDSLTAAIEVALKPYGLTVRRADRRNYASTKQLWDNARIHMLGCMYGIAVLESKYKDEFNPNVALEYGFMNALGREVILLIEESFKHRRADIVGTLGKTFNLSGKPGEMQESVAEAIDSWMIDIGKPKIQKDNT
jgi:hypothetical protein